MKRMHDSTRLTELFVKIGLIAAVAAVLLVPTTIRVHGGEALRAVEPGWSILKRASFEPLPLPPIPYLETMPWLGWQRTPAAFKIDTLLGPRFEVMGPEVASSGSDAPSLLRRASGAAGTSSNG